MKKDALRDLTCFWNLGPHQSASKKFHLKVLDIRNFLIFKWPAKEKVPREGGWVQMVRTEPFDSEEILNKWRNQTISSKGLIHISCHKRILLPLPDLRTTKDSTWFHILEIFFQVLRRLRTEFPAICQWYKVGPWVLKTTLPKNESVSWINLDSHLATRAKFLWVNPPIPSHHPFGL